MLLGFLDTPGDFVEHLRRYTASLTTQMTFGKRTTSVHDTRFTKAFDVCASTGPNFSKLSMLPSLS